MLRRSFLQLLAGLGAAAALSPLEALVPLSPAPVLALEVTDPYWLLELQAYERFLARVGPKVPGVRRSRAVMLPAKPLEAERG